LEAKDWVGVDAARDCLHALDAAAAAGPAVRTQVPLADGELAAYGGPSTGLCAIKTKDGVILSSPEEVKREVSSFFQTLFHGHHEALEADTGPIDSGPNFHPDQNLFFNLLDGLPSLFDEQRTDLEQPFHYCELKAAVEAAASSKAPGPDDLSYEFYKKTINLVGPALLDGLNAMPVLASSPHLIAME